MASGKPPNGLHAILKTCLKPLLRVAESLERLNWDTFTNLRAVAGSVKEGWDELRWEGDHCSDFKTALVVSILLMIYPFYNVIAWATAFVGYFIFIILGLIRPLRRLSGYLDETAFQGQFFLPILKDTGKRKEGAIAPPFSITSSPTQGTCRFFWLPTEIRYWILAYAFGGRTMHMSLEFQFPFYMSKFDRCDEPRLSCHAKIEHMLEVKNSHLHTEEPKRWVWFGCTCHRSSCSGEVRYLDQTSETFKTVEQGWNGLCEPKYDRCMEGIARCREWPGAWPDKCQIGILGWLLTCRQAYIEGFDILYGANTIHIASPALHRSMQNILSHAVLSHMTSLELVWDLDSVPLDQGFKTTSKKRAENHSSPLFPGMLRLRLAFSNASDCAKCIGLDRDAISSRQIKEILTDQLFPMIDTLLDRIVPGTTDVTVSCPSWRWHSAVDLAIIDLQGEDANAQHAEFGGIKFWRNTPVHQPVPPSETRGDVNDGDLEGGALGNGRKGFWVHTSEREHLPWQSETPEYRRRRELYDLKDYTSVLSSQAQ